MGHLAIEPAELTWWRHLSRRHRPLRIPTQALSFDRSRSVGLVERWSVSGRCTVLLCSGPQGTVEFALLNQSDVDDLLRTLRPSTTADG